MLIVPLISADQSDPFADIEVVVLPPATNAETAVSAPVWNDNLLLRRELYLLFGIGKREGVYHDAHRLMSRVSAGFEVQKRFATPTRTIASFDYQGRLVYRNHYLTTAADSMGMDAKPWKYETHNAYADFYNVFGAPGIFNIRAGYFYQPFGLIQQTDTHGTLLQLSNDQVFGTERDMQIVMYGTLNAALDYQFGYLFGLGPDEKFAGQTGMLVSRVALNNDWLFDYGLEGGISFAFGERMVSRHMSKSMRPSLMDAIDFFRSSPTLEDWFERYVDYRLMRLNFDPVKTMRFGADARKRLASGIGPFTVTIETAAGTDNGDLVLSGLAQTDWLNPRRRWGVAAQIYGLKKQSEGINEAMSDTTASFVITRYFRNDVGNAGLHWVALAIEQPVHRSDGSEAPLFMLQYYNYW
jgi:hypothetical protein